MNPEQLPVYTPEYQHCPQLNGTWHVRRVSSGLVAKLSRSWEFFVDMDTDEEERRKSNEAVRDSLLIGLENEYSMLKAVYEAGVSVPKPEGVFLVPVPRDGILNYLQGRKLLTPGILMQYIAGIPMNKLRGKRLDEAFRLRHEELRKCKIAGFDPLDTIERNAIYSPLENKVYLVDVENWQTIDPANPVLLP
ncbi:hypothetical protein HYU22_01090 [Candidatus Woesearchaeota archaeon]|nr:hypothetical protein [Candidatus Woesearchaeota archaeon]